MNKRCPTVSLKQRLAFFTLIFLITLYPVISFADADKIFKENSKAVVVVVTLDKEGNPLMQGSGFIVRADGAIVTNYHVISNAVDIKVKAGDKVLDVEGLIYTDKENDLVILKAKGERFQTVRLGDIAKTNIGEKVYVISSPEGLENTISDGILSGIREITPDKKILQITAPVSHGSSGGAVFNNNGEVIGIATSIIEEAQNLNFAMPVNLIKDKIENKKVTALKESKIEDYKKTAESWFYRGVAYVEAGMYREAIEAFKQAIRIKPDYAVAHISLGLAYSMSGMWKEAIKAHKQAIRIKPDYAAHYSLGLAYEILGRHQEAIEAYKQAIRIEPDNADAHYCLGSAYDKSGMLREAIEAYKQTIRIKPDYAEVHNTLGNAYFNSGMYKEAMEAHKQAIRIKPDFAEAHLGLGVAYVLSGKWNDAAEAYKQAIRINPDYAEAHLGLGLAYLLVNDRGSALEEYKKLKELDPERANKLFNAIYK